MRRLTCQGSSTGCWSQHPKVSEQQRDVPAPRVSFETRQQAAQARAQRAHSGGVKSRAGFCKTSVMVTTHDNRNKKSHPHPNH